MMPIRIWKDEQLAIDHCSKLFMSWVLDDNCCYGYDHCETCNFNHSDDCTAPVGTLPVSIPPDSDYLELTYEQLISDYPELLL